MNSEGSEPKVNPEDNEESILNRPRPKLKLAELKNKPETSVPEQAPVSTPPPERVIKDQTVHKKREEDEKKREEEEKKRELAEEKRKIKLELKKNTPQLISFKETAKYMAGNSRLIVSLLGTALVMVFVSIFLYHMIFSFVSGLTAPFYTAPPLIEEFYHYFYYAGWAIFKFFFSASVTIFIFYATYIISYLISSPIYSFISYASENTFLGKPEEESDFDASYIGEDLLQAAKTSLLAVAVTVYLFFVNFVPVIGQIFVFVLYPVLNTILVIDFYAYRKEWTLASRILWIKENPLLSLIVGGSITFISMIPLLNNILAALVIPFALVYSSINMAVIQKYNEKKKTDAENN